MPGMVANSIPCVNSYLLVPRMEATSYLKNMRPKDIRRNNLACLVEKFGSIAEVARRCNTSEKYLSQVLTKRVQRNSERGIGDIVAVKLEVGCEMPPGWIDIDHSNDKPEIEAAAMEPEPKAYFKPPGITKDEELILKAFRQFSDDLRDSWITTAKQFLRKNNRAKENAAA